MKLKVQMTNPPIKEKLNRDSILLVSHEKKLKTIIQIIKNLSKQIFSQLSVVSSTFGG